MAWGHELFAFFFLLADWGCRAGNHLLLLPPYRPCHNGPLKLKAQLIFLQFTFVRYFIIVVLKIMNILTNYFWNFPWNVFQPYLTGNNLNYRI